MALTLYHYVHCPYCIRVRMALGYLGIGYISQVLSYDDEITPVNLSGKKMLPILKADQHIINESLDIIALIDKENKLQVKTFTSSSEFENFDSLLNTIGSSIHSLAMPYWIFTPEFSPQARSYFQMKKEGKRGPFKELVRDQKVYFEKLSPLLQQIENSLRPYYESSSFTLKDILLASHLWGLYVVPEFQFSEKIHQYLQLVKKQCRFDYHKDLWS